MQADRQRLTGLVARALAIADPDPEDRWPIVRELHGRGDRLTFEVACALARADDPVERVLGIDVLGQLGYRDGRPFAAETLPVLLAAGAPPWRCGSRLLSRCPRWRVTRQPRTRWSP